MHGVFVYGSLMADAVLEALLGRTFASRPGRLPGFRRGRLRGRSYPAVVPAPGAVVEGLVLQAVDDESLGLLDRFEGNLYERRLAPVEVGPERVGAFVWVLAEASRGLVTEEAWDLEAFLREDGEAFIAGCRRFREELP